MVVKITKLEELESPIHHNNIMVGFERIGTIINLPKVGECFWVDSFRTSTVKEIINENTFKTCNSIYTFSEIKTPKNETTI